MWVAIRTWWEDIEDLVGPFETYEAAQDFVNKRMAQHQCWTAYEINPPKE